MRVKMAAVISLDGKIKKAAKVHKRDWISDEDKVYFRKLMDEYDLIVMGRKTYASMELRPRNGKQYVVVTRNPALYATNNTKDSIEFCDSTPQEIVMKYGELGFSRLLLVGGGSLYTAFLNAKLVDMLDITIEPIILGKGKSLVDCINVTVELQVIHQFRLNSRGTLLLQLKVVKNNRDIRLVSLPAP